MSAPILYKSTDTSAPTLNGNAGSLVTVLDACLVNGYGSQSAAGWSKAFSGTNKADYRQANGNQFYLDVDDSAAQTAAGKEANLRGYETMSALATGTNLFPTTGQIGSPGPQIRKSATADATARAWMILADDRTFYMWVKTGDDTAYRGWYFGDIYSLGGSGDTGRTILCARNSANGTGDSSWENDRWDMQNALSNSFVIARKYGAGAGSSRTNTYSTGQNTPLGGTQSAAPAYDGNIYVQPRWVGGGDDSTANVRGKLRGLWKLMHNTGVNDGDTFTGTGDLSGRSFVILGSTVQSCFYALETSNTWDTN